MRRVSAKGVLVALVACAGCAGAAPAPESALDVDDPRRFFPLEAGTVYSYAVRDGGPMPTLATLRVLEVDPATGRARIQRNREEPETLQITEEGIRFADGGGWLLRAPLEVDARFEGQAGRDARVLSTDAALRTGLGEHRGCVTIEERDLALGIVAETTYCPDVGPVRIVSRMRSTLVDVTIEVRAELLGRVRAQDTPASEGTTTTVRTDAR